MMEQRTNPTLNGDHVTTAETYTAHVVGDTSFIYTVQNLCKFEFGF